MTCKGCGMSADRGGSFRYGDYCSVSCMKNKVGELRVNYWDLVRKIRDSEVRRPS